MGWLCLLEVLLEPADDALDPVDAAVGPADREHHVGLGWIPDHLHLSAERAQDVKHHLAVARWAAHVVLGLQQQQGCVVEVHLHEWRPGEECVKVLPWTLRLDGPATDEAA